MTGARHFMAYPGYQRRDMEHKARLAADSTNSVQQIFVPMGNGSTKHAPGDAPDVLFANGSWWRLDQVIEPNPRHMYAGLPDGRFPWER